MLREAKIRHDTAHHVARKALVLAATQDMKAGEYCRIIRKLCGVAGLPQPDDVLAWVTDGMTTDADIDMGEPFDAAYLG